MPYLKGVGLSRDELQQRELEAAVMHKKEMDAAKARGKGTLTQALVTSALEVGASRSRTVPSALQAQQDP